MQNIRRPRSLGKKGFTLIELMIVVVIIGILAALAIPRFGQATARAKEKEADGILKSLYTAQTAYSAKRNAYATDPVVLNTEVGWEQPPQLQNYQPIATPIPPFPVTMTKTGSGYCDRIISDVGVITSGTC
jgi:prepilin-type N-terminal cleavage/methylation domain-containing protein